MPKLPFAGFTAGEVGRGPGAPPPAPRVTAESFGAAEARAQAQLGAGLQQAGLAIIQREQEREERQVKVESAKVASDFARELDEAVKTGGDFQEVVERNSNRIGEIGENIVTRGGRAAHEAAVVRAEEGFEAAIRSAEAKRVGLETKTQTRDFVNILGANVLQNPASIDTSIEEMDAFVDTFSQLRPEERAVLKQNAANELSMAAANGLLRTDPLVLKEALEQGGLEDLRAGQRAAFLQRADAELRRGAQEAKSQDEMAKLLTRQALAAEAEDHVLTNEEAQEWFDRGVTASQFDSAMAKSVEAEEARQKLAKDILTISNGGGATLDRSSYENALERLTQDATKNLPPEEAAAAAVNIRVESAVQNGREDSKLRSLLNAGPVGGDQTFEAGLSLRADLQARSPELLHKMLDGNSRAWYNSFDYMVQNLGIDPEAARGRLLETATNQKEMETRLRSKENRELLEDAISISHEGQNALVQQELAERASFYMALVPTLTAEQAIELSARDFEESTVEIGQGVRANVTGVPINWEPADKFVRRSALRRDLRAADIEMSTEELDDSIFIPNGDGTVAVIGPDNLIIFPAWDWQGAVDEWWVTIGQADLAAEQKKTASRAKKAQERALEIGEILGTQTFGGPGL